MQLPPSRTRVVFFCSWKSWKTPLLYPHHGSLRYGGLGRDTGVTYQRFEGIAGRNRNIESRLARGTASAAGNRVLVRTLAILGGVNGQRGGLEVLGLVLRGLRHAGSVLGGSQRLGAIHDARCGSIRHFYRGIENPAKIGRSQQKEHHYGYEDRQLHHRVAGALSLCCSCVGDHRVTPSVRRTASAPRPPGWYSCCEGYSFQ